MTMMLITKNNNDFYTATINNTEERFSVKLNHFIDLSLKETEINEGPKGWDPETRTYLDSRAMKWLRVKIEALRNKGYKLVELEV